MERVDTPALRSLFRHAEPLGAANVIKRVWHKAYLETLSNHHPGLPNLERARESFDSVPAVAAGAWLHALGKRLEIDPELWTGMISLSEALYACRGVLRSISIPDRMGKSSKVTEDRWLDRIDGEVFTSRFWDTLPADVRTNDSVRHACSQVERLKARHNLGEPPAYYAVLALDGDQIGRWLSGEKSPPVGRILSTNARDYFENRMLPAMTADERKQFESDLAKLKTNCPKRPEEEWQGQWPPQSPEEWIRAWLACPRPLSPSWHLQFSEALANFGLHAARRIVQDVHHGQLIYSGGDDVLAMLPASEAITCATDLRAAFQGRRDAMSSDCMRLFREEAPEGFLWLKEPSHGDPEWPLLMPGPRMTVSVGIAIGHVKEPLQDLVLEAQRAEKRAKADPEKRVFDRNNPESGKHTEKWKTTGGWGRNAVAVTLYKRSGEILYWGARFGSNAFEVLEQLRQHFRVPWGKSDARTPITGRFPHRVAELLSPYGSTTPVSQLKDIVLREIDFIINRQTMSDAETAKLAQPSGGSPFKREVLLEECGRYLDELAEFSWKRPDQEASTNISRPLQDFINLFLLEAFIRRQAD